MLSSTVLVTFCVMITIEEKREEKCQIVHASVHTFVAKNGVYVHQPVGLTIATKQEINSNRRTRANDKILIAGDSSGTRARDRERE